MNSNATRFQQKNLNPHQVQFCRQHIEQEESHLERTLQSLEEVRAAIAKGQPRDLAAALQNQEAVLQAGFRLRQERERVRTELARVLDLPVGDVSLNALAGRLEMIPQAEWQEKRHRLQDLAARVERLNRTIANASFHHLEFLNHFFEELTGTRAAGGRYGPEGQRIQPACGSMFSGQG